MIPQDGRPYYTLDAWCKEHFGEKLYKIALDAGFTCPNRDGTLGTRGCIFCSAGGSGDFAAKAEQGGGDAPSCCPDIHAQLQAGKALLASKSTGKRYIAYFQAYTNTYGPVPYLETIFSQALREQDIAGISIATRPDCLPPEVFALLVSLKERFPGKFIWVELGLQTIHEKTALYIRRGYPLSCYDTAVKRLREADIPVITHFILGLPGENREMMLDTIRHLNQSGTWGVKLQLLHVLEGTDLAADFRAGRFDVLTEEAYLDLLTRCISALSPHIVIHRVTGDGPKDLLIAPLWSRNKRHVLNSLHQIMKRDSIRQGKCYESGTDDPL